MKLRLLMLYVCSLSLMNCGALPGKKKSSKDKSEETDKKETDDSKNGKNKPSDDAKEFKPTKKQVTEYAKSLKSEFDKIMSAGATDINASANATSKTFYQTRTTRQFMSLLLSIKTYEAIGKKSDEYKSINNSVDQSLKNETDYAVVYPMNESGLIELYAAYSSAVDKAKSIKSAKSGTSDKGNFADMTNKVPTAVYHSALAMRQAIEAEQGHDLSQFYDAKITKYEDESLNIHKLHTALMMRADTALFLLEKVNKPKAESIRDSAATLRILVSGGYQIAELWSQAELEATIAQLKFYMD